MASAAVQALLKDAALSLAQDLEVVPVKEKLPLDPRGLTTARSAKVPYGWELEGVQIFDEWPR